MKNKPVNKAREKPLLYYKTQKEIKEYRKKPVKQKLQWLEAQMEFFHKAMSDKSKKIRNGLRERE
jgi:hypothetical protein